MDPAPDPPGKSHKRRTPRFALEKPAVRRRLLIEAAICSLGAFTIGRICAKARYRAA